MNNEQSMENFHTGEIEATVLFLDIENFTGITEILCPGETYQFIRKVILPLTECVKKHNGYVCQVQGDAIMAVFGHDDTSSGHARNAVQCAREQRTEVQKLNPVLISDYRIPLSVRIGISSGPMYACYNALPDRKEYTVLGRKVNIAFRLQEINKRYGTNILIDASTFAYIKTGVLTRKLDRVKISGCSGTLPVYEVLTPAVHCSEKAFQRKEYYEKGLEHYRSGNWDRAIHFFSRIAEDKASYIMIERCKKHKAATDKENS